MCAVIVKAIIAEDPDGKSAVFGSEVGGRIPGIDGSNFVYCPAGHRDEFRPDRGEDVGGRKRMPASGKSSQVGRLDWENITIQVDRGGGGEGGQAGKCFGGCKCQSRCKGNGIRRGGSQRECRWNGRSSQGWRRGGTG